MRGLVDTSVLIALESGRYIDIQRLPDDSAVSVVTVAELRARALGAGDIDSRAARLRTLHSLSDFQLVGIDDRTAQLWALLRAHLDESGAYVDVNDLWIAATAAAHDLPVVTQDDDFGPVEGIGGLEVIRV